MARPTKFQAKYCEEVTRLCLLGSTDADLAQAFQVGEATIKQWKKQHPEFRQAIKEGKEQADSNVADSLYKRALKGDTIACIFWLKNRKSTVWRDKHELTGSDGGPIEYVARSILELSPERPELCDSSFQASAKSNQLQRSADPARQLSDGNVIDGQLNGPKRD